MIRFLRLLSAAMFLGGILSLTQSESCSARSNPGVTRSDPPLGQIPVELPRAKVCEPVTPSLPMNVIVEFSADLVAAAFHNTDVTHEPVDEVILGAKVEGHAVSYSVSHVELIPDEHRALTEIVVNVKSYSTNRSTRKSFQTYTTSVTNIQVRKPVWVTLAGIRWDYAYAALRTDSHLDAIDTGHKGLLDAILRPMVRCGYAHSEEKGRQEGDCKGGVRLLAELDRDSEKDLAKQDRDFHENLIGRLRKKNILANPVLFRTTRDLMIVTGRLADEPEPPTIPPPPCAAGLPAMAMRLHESALNTAANRMYAGQTRTPEGFQKDMADLGMSSESNNKREVKEADKKEDFEVTFVRKDPILFRFDDQRVKITFRTAGFKEKGQPWKRSWQTTITFRLEKKEGKFHLGREGEINPEPLDPETLKPIEMSAPMIFERRALLRLAQRAIMPDYPLDDIEPTGELEKIGTLKLTQVLSSNGWMLQAWTRIPRQPRTEHKQSEPKPEKEKAKPKGDTEGPEKTR